MSQRVLSGAGQRAVWGAEVRRSYNNNNNNNNNNNKCSPRANLLSRDYKWALQQVRRGDRRQGAGSRQEAPLCEGCYSAQPLAAAHLCLECDRLMCHVCLEIHSR